MEFTFDTIDYEPTEDNLKEDNLKEDNSENTQIIQYDKTTTEYYRMKRIFGIDPLTDNKVEETRLFKYYNAWNPYTGQIIDTDVVGPLCFNAINLYDYYYQNRYKGLWYPATHQYQGYYGELVGTGKNINIISRGVCPEKYLFRIPIIDCYLPEGHNLSHITMGPLLFNQDIINIDYIVKKYHPYRNNYNFASLRTLKMYYDNALVINDTECEEIKNLRKNNSNLTDKEVCDLYHRFWVDKLVNLRY